MTRDQTIVRSLFADLQREKPKHFPERGSCSKVPAKQGVYIIYSPSKKVVHVGRTYRGTAGLRQRMNNHLYGASSFTIEYLKRNGRKLRRGYTYRYLTIRSHRHRAFVEAYASGYLCPLHLGTGKKKRRQFP